MIPPPVDGFLIEEVNDTFRACLGNIDTGLLTVFKQGIVEAIIENRTDMESEHIDMVGIDGVDHSLWIGKLRLELETAAAITVSLVEGAPGGVEPQQIERNPFTPHPLHQFYVILLISFFLVSPGASTITAQMQTIGRTGHHRTNACQGLVVM